VGQAPNLQALRKAAVLVDGNNNGVADVGEELRFVLTVRNQGAGAAQNVLLQDPLANNVQFVGGSLLLDGQPQTDAADLDAARWETGAIVLQLAELAAGASRELQFRVRIVAGPGCQQPGQHPRRWLVGRTIRRR
jgi:uncharacterized repeat protein (TIGR01451 family)